MAHPSTFPDRSLALLLGLAACAVDPGDGPVEPPPMERVNGIDDDGDGEIDEPVSFSEADLQWVGVTEVQRGRPPGADPTPDLVPLRAVGVSLVPPLGLWRDRTAEDRVVVWGDWDGGVLSFDYTADLDGDGVGELYTRGYTAYEGIPQVQAWSGAALAADVPLAEPDFLCGSEKDWYGDEFTVMADLGPLSGDGTNIACGFDVLGSIRVPIYGAEAFADGMARQEEAPRILYLAEDAAIDTSRTDFDGDGIPDLLTSRTYGGLTMFSGAELTPGLFGEADATLAWTMPEAWLYRVADDVTGDGRPDLLVGDSGGATRSTTGDKSWLVDPARGGGDLAKVAVSSFDLDTNSWQSDLVGLDDGDGDGHAEVLIGRSHIGAILGTGVAYLLPGATLATPGSYGPADAEVTFVAEDQGQLSRFGMGFSARDLLGDGRLSVVFEGPGDAAGVFVDLTRR